MTTVLSHENTEDKDEAILGLFSMLVASFICLSRVISEKMLNWIFHSFVPNPKFQHWSEVVTKNLSSIWDLPVLLCFLSDVRTFFITQDIIGWFSWLIQQYFSGYMPEFPDKLIFPLLLTQIFSNKACWLLFSRDDQVS